MGPGVAVGSGMVVVAGTAVAAAAVGDRVAVGLMMTVTAMPACLIGVGLVGTGGGVGETAVAHPTTPSRTNSKKMALVRIGKSYW